MKLVSPHKPVSKDGNCRWCNFPNAQPSQKSGITQSVSCKPRMAWSLFMLMIVWGQDDINDDATSCDSELLPALNLVLPRSVETRAMLSTVSIPHVRIPQVRWRLPRSLQRHKSLRGCDGEACGLRGRDACGLACGEECGLRLPLRFGTEESTWDVCDKKRADRGVSSFQWPSSPKVGTTSVCCSRSLSSAFLCCCSSNDMNGRGKTDSHLILTSYRKSYAVNVHRTARMYTRRALSKENMRICESHLFHSLPDLTFFIKDAASELLSSVWLAVTISQAVTKGPYAWGKLPSSIVIASLNPGSLKSRSWLLIISIFPIQAA